MLRLLLSRALASGLAGAALLAPSFASAARAAAPPRSAAQRTAVIERIDLVDLAPGARLELVFDRELSWTLGRDAEGRLTIDLPEARPGLGVVSRVVPGGLVAEIRLASVGVPSRPVTRVVVATRAPADHRVEASGGRLRLELVPAGTGFPASIAPSPAASPPPPVGPAPPRPRPPATPPAPRAVDPLPAVPVAPPSPVAAHSAAEPLAVAEPEPPPAIEATDLDAEPPAAPLPALESEVAPPPPPLAGQPVGPLREPSPKPPAEIALPPRAELRVDEPKRVAPAPADVALAAPREPLPPAPAPPPTLREVATELRSIARLAPGVLAVAGDGPFEYTGFRLESPARFVLDLHGVRNLVAQGVLSIDEGVLARVRVSQYRLAPAPVTRVIFDLRTPTLPAIEPAADGLLVRFPEAPPEGGARPDPAPFG